MQDLLSDFRSLPQALDMVASLHPHRAAIVDARRSVSYRDLTGLCRAGAAVLQRRWQSSRYVAVLGDHDTDLFLAALACIYAGKTIVVLDKDAPIAYLRHLTGLAGASVLAASECLLPLAEQLAPDPADVFSMPGLIDVRKICVDPGELPAIDPDSPVCIFFTSGSTGSPKGVLASHRTLFQSAMVCARRMGYSSQDRVTLLHQLRFCSGMRSAFSALLSGACLLPYSFRVNGYQSMREWMLAVEPTVLHAPPRLFRGFCEGLPEGAKFQSVRAIRLGGEPVLAEDVRSWQRFFPEDSVLMNGLGMTEANGVLCMYQLTRDCEPPAATVPVGYPLPGVDILLLDDFGRPVESGGVGEIAFRAPYRSPGYWNSDDWSSRLIPAPDGRGEAYFRTGDLGRFQKDGSLLHLGRKDDLIKLRGFRVEPAEIEACLLAHPSVAQVAVIVRHDDQGDPRLIAYWLPRRSAAQAASADLLRSFLAERLPDYMLPTAFMELDVLPLTTNGKLDRKSLPAPTFAAAQDQRLEPSTNLERQLHAIWAEVLGHRDFGITDNFFAIGGHSLAAARLFVRVEQELGVGLPLATIFHAPRIRAMADLLQRPDRAEALGDPCLVPLQTRGEGSPLFVIHGYGGDVFCYSEFALALDPARPVYGLQALGLDDSRLRQVSLEEMAEHYAGLIERQWPQGEVHLLGQSAGGWYAWSVASALLRRGRTVGMLAILDSGPSAAISRRLRSSLLMRRALRRLPLHLRQLRHHKRPRHLLAFLRQRSLSLTAQLSRLQPRRPPANTSSLDQGLTATELEPFDPANLAGWYNDYFTHLHNCYRPTPQPLSVHLLTSRHEIRLKLRLWRAFARRGVCCRPLFDEHHHFHTPAYAVELAAAVAACLQEHEARRSQG